MKEHLPSPILQLCETLQGVNQNLYEQCQQPSFPWIALGVTLVLLVLIGIGFQKSPRFTGIAVLLGSWALAVFCLAMIALHLSGWAEEWIIWSSVEFGFVELPEAFCTGSSIMPQKINPDVLELIRGKAARVVGDLHTLLVLVKALPLAYNRDLQEDKPALLDAFDTVGACLSLAAPLVENARLNRQAIAEKLDRGYLDATNLMEYLIARKIPQRTAHEMVGRLVRQAMQRGVALKQLPLEVFQSEEPSLGEEIYQVLGVEQAVAAARSYGSTNPALVAEQVALWKQRLGMTSEESIP